MTGCLLIQSESRVKAESFVEEFRQVGKAKSDVPCKAMRTRSAWGERWLEMEEKRKRETKRADDGASTLASVPLSETCDLGSGEWL